MSGNLLHFLFPNACLVCNKPIRENRSVCDACKSAIYYIGRNSGCKTCLAPVSKGQVFCGKCMMRPPKYERLISCVYFRGAIRTAFHRYKFFDEPHLHTAFSNLLISRLTEMQCTDFDMVIPVPLSKERFKERGYNQAALIAEDVAHHFNILYNKEAIFRKRHTERQSELPRRYREGNVLGAFSLGNTDGLAGKHVLLVDDIITSGATMREVSRTLAKSGCRITACTVAATVYDDNVPFGEYK